jgi:uncharacterized protein (DUF952 family)
MWRRQLTASSAVHRSISPTASSISRPQRRRETAAKHFAGQRDLVLVGRQQAQGDLS